MTIDEAIKSMEMIAEDNQRVVDTRIVYDDVTIDMLYCDDTEVIEEQLEKIKESAEKYRQFADWLKELKQLREKTRWIPVNERLPELDEEACSNDVLLSLRKIIWDTHKCQMVHITEIAYYDENAISSDGVYLDTEGWVLKDGSTLSMDEVIAWMPLPESYNEVIAWIPLPEPYKAESEVGK